MFTTARPRGGALHLAALGALVALLLTGCEVAPRGVTVPPGSEDLPACPLRELPATALSEVGAPKCDLEGSILTFDDLDSRFDVEAISAPGGVPSLTVTAVGATVSHGDGRGRELMMVNWGVPGVAVALVDDGRLVEIWASSSEALALHREALSLDGVGID